jgi:hypothetical protein
MNMGIVDRVIRGVIGLALVLVASLLLNGAAQIGLWVVGAILLVTAAVSFCPLYSILHLSTKPKKA